MREAAAEAAMAAAIAAPSVAELRAMPLPGQGPAMPTQGVLRPRLEPKGLEVEDAPATPLAVGACQAARKLVNNRMRVGC